VLPAYRRAFLIQKSAGGGLSYKVKKKPGTPHSCVVSGLITVLINPYQDIKL